MKPKINFLLFYLVILANALYSSEEFQGWGPTILHHVGNPEAFWANPSASLLNICLEQSSEISSYMFNVFSQI